MIGTKDLFKVIATGLILLSSSSAAYVLAEEETDPAVAPVWPPQWHADFSVEWWRNFWHVSTNGGSYHYDWKNGVSSEVHGEGQRDNWCHCASSKNAECKIISTATAMYAVLPTENVCCKLFEGVGTLKPTWLEGTNFDGYERAGDPKRKCQKWLNPNPGNPLMKGDLWLIDDDGVPCGYVDVFKWWSRWLLGEGHYWDFDESTYSTEEEPSDVFALPDDTDCNVPCANPWYKPPYIKPWCASAWKGPKTTGVDQEL